VEDEELVYFGSLAWRDDDTRELNVRAMLNHLDEVGRYCVRFIAVGNLSFFPNLRSDRVQLRVAKISPRTDRKNLSENSELSQRVVAREAVPRRSPLWDPMVKLDQLPHQPHYVDCPTRDLQCHLTKHPQ